MIQNLDEHNFYIELGFFLYKMRRMQGLAQKDIADKMGVTFQQIQKYERGDNRIPVYHLMRYAEILEISPASFFENGFPNAPCRVLDPETINAHIADAHKALDVLSKELFN